MKTKLIYKTLAACICLLVCSVSAHAQTSEEGKSLFNEDWQFHKGNIDLKEQDLKTLNWRDVTLPHDWSIEGPFDSKWASGTGFLPGGIAWYRKSFNVDWYDPKMRYAIYFDGVYKNSDVWINGNWIGRRPNGFIPFEYDLTPYLKQNDNEILVRVDHAQYADSRYYTGSGIYRNVYLKTKAPIHFKTWGISFQTPEVTPEQAHFLITVEFQNTANASANVELQASLKDASGHTVYTEKLPAEANANSSAAVTLKGMIQKPELWSPEKPHLYTLSLDLIESGKPIDSQTQQVGFRSFNFDADTGFTLNGKNALLKGVCIHHDAGALGAAVPKEVWAERLQTLKDLGCNAIRMSHYPHQDYLYELCDEMGFLVQDEAFDEWARGKNKWIEGWNVGTPGNDGSYIDFSEWGKRDVQDMIKRNRNHPSIIMWSIGNEIDYPNDPYTHPVLDTGRNPQIFGRGFKPGNPAAEDLGVLAKELVAAAKAIDTTRPITAALAGVPMSNETTYPESLDIVGYNYQEYRYAEDHQNYPDRIIYGSENGDAYSAWKAVTDNPYIASQFIWTAFDFIGEARPWPKRGSEAGILDLAGKPKPDFFFRQSFWSEKPMVYIGVTNTEENARKRRNLKAEWSGDEGTSNYVSFYSNAEEVELILNGKSLGKQQVVYADDAMPYFKVPYQDGRLEARAYVNGIVVAHTLLETPRELKKIKLTTAALPRVIEDPSVLIIDLELVDKNGTLLNGKDEEVDFIVDESLNLLGVENADQSNHRSYTDTTQSTYKGKLRAYFKKTGKAGELKIIPKNKKLKTLSYTVK
ncbi:MULTISPECIES: glycoside hydrolase family 2 TIM barrel-domain containing protein [unclassified Leeuwenhoekiella]|uniref:glycoside hydrolase family 2 TIM barrel-domain containing protein n=1 Tax=unclassified Leeuwenhoekiella TaxID=2615029 RepID=UPI000C602B3E|nr:MULTISPECIES: glycoside hydrolase family 2 TIM barrel-domain containing protein [unclassified Leeuwenhoekiella]MAW96456.1 beta-galactosidase [Leeuwenhoekiella sp.]MBA81343.1 beta-galactosidase [Leeuwenhoekiella sp.]|tara:strand:- start:25903 stop:28323 length:2421 start_codon:yes stop_codon:yes gene_type:complete